MSNHSSPLGLYIPQQTIEHPDMPYLKPKDAEQWIAKLPTAHIGETARLIYKAMASINRTPLPPQQRFKVLELFREPFEHVNQALRKRHLNQAFPLSDKNLKIAELARELLWELAIGYKIIIEASFSKKSGRVDNRLLLTAVFRTVCYLGDSLLSAYLTYSPPQAKRTWREIHHLYLFAECNQLMLKTVKDDVTTLQQNRSIAAVYKHIILLSLSNPYRLSQNEILSINHALIKWAEYSTLHMFDNVNRLSGIFAIDLEGGAAPSYYNTSTKPIDTNYVRILDTSTLTQMLIDQYEEPEIETQNTLLDAKEKLNKETLHRLILAWGVTAKRHFSRKGKETEIRMSITTGLSSTHFHIREQYEIGQQEKSQGSSSILQAKFPGKAEYINNSITSLYDSDSQPDVWDIFSELKVEAKAKTKYRLTPFNQYAPPKHEAPVEAVEIERAEVYDCLLINESSGGYCISWDNSSRTKTIIGSLLGIKRKTGGESDDWNIGIIRWLKSPEKTPMYIGIEVLSSAANAIASRYISETGECGEYTRALLLPESPSTKRTQTLITQFSHKIGDRLELDVHGQSINVKLTKVLESNNAFNQFEFSIIKPNLRADAANQADGIKDFDSVWSSI